MLENGFSSPRSDAFPAGLRVLVVDDDPTWLKILEKMLKKCSYEVTTCCLARDALSLLRERKDGYDIVISDVNMPDMDGFKLLEHVGLEMDLPVIMMSVDGETSRVMKGVQHGACDYLLKPIRMKELRNIWQHVLRKKIHEVRDIESHEGLEVLHMMRHGSDQTEDSLFLSGEDFSSGKKRKDVDGKHDDFGDSSSSKKPRVVWTVELHQKFVEAVNEIGFEKIGPKRILDSMKVPWLTRENVASHLQKYRLYLSRLQKENDLKVSFNGTKHPDLYLKDTMGNFSIQNLTNTHQNEVASADFVFSSSKLLVQEGNQNEVASGDFVFSSSKLLVQEGNSEGIASVPVIESKGSLIGDVHVPDVKKAGSAELGFSNPIASLESDVHCEAFESTNPTRYSWVEVPEIQFKQEHEPLLQMDSFINPPLSGLGNNIQVDQLPLQPATSFTSRPSIRGIDIPSKLEHKPLYEEFRDNHVTHISSTEFAVNSPPALSTTHLANYQALETICPTTLGTKNESCSLNGITGLEGTQRNPILGNGSALGSFNEDLQFSWLQGDYYDKSLQVQNIEFSEVNDPGILGEVPVHLYDALRFDFEYPCDPIIF